MKTIPPDITAAIETKGHALVIVGPDYLTFNVGMLTAHPQGLRVMQVFPESQHDVHTVDCDDWTYDGTALTLYKDEQPVATVAPYDEVYIADVGQWVIRHHQWRTALATAEPDDLSFLQELLLEG
jgi:hypothetical protein